MNIYIIPAIIAFIITAYILVNVAKSETQSKTFTIMVLFFLVHHACEVLSFIEFFKEKGQMLLILKIFYTATLWFLAIILIYANEVSKIKLRYLKVGLISTCVPLSFLILFGNLIIAGSASLGYVMTAVKGDYYFLFQITAALFLISTPILLNYGRIKAKEHITEIQCTYMLFAFAPLMLTLISILALMAMGIKINAIAVVPIASALFLMITAKCEAKHKLTDIRRYMPLSSERKTSQEIMELFSSYARDELSYRESVNEIEKLLVMHKYSKNGKNASATAQTMGMPRSSLYSIFNRLSIDLKDEK